MKVRIMSNIWYEKQGLIVGNVYKAKKSPNGENYLVLSDSGIWLCMFPKELRFICETTLEDSDI